MTNQLYRVWCRYEPDHINMPAGRRGQWRVSGCYEVITKRCLLRSGFQIGLLSTKRYPKGCIIRPHKELNRVLAQLRKPKCPKHDTGGGPCYCEGSIHAEAA